LDGATFATWWKGIGDALRWPWFDRSVDGVSPPAPTVSAEPFESLKAFAASGHAGCKAARERLKHATNAGLARALGRDLPAVLQ
jgi:hypothetical protein